MIISHLELNSPIRAHGKLHLVEHTDDKYRQMREMEDLKPVFFTLSTVWIGHSAAHQDERGKASHGAQALRHMAIFQVIGCLTQMQLPRIIQLSVKDGQRKLFCR